MESNKKQTSEEVFFSIVVPSYNREKFIERTLRTIQLQSFGDFEVIIVDDCSTDNTVDRIKPFLNDKRFKLIQNPLNLERAKSRNIGMANAKGNFLTLLDSDDLMYPDCLRDAYAYSVKNPEMLFFRNLYEMVDEDGKVLKKFNKSVVGNDFKELSKGNFISCIGVFLHKNIYKNLFFDEDPRIIVSEDWEYWLRVRSKHKLGTIWKINCAFTEHPNRSMSKFDPEEILARKIIIINKTMQNAQTRKVYGKYEKLMQVSALIFVAVQANMAGQPTVAIEYLKKAAQTSLWLCFQKRFFVVLKNALAAII